MTTVRWAATIGAAGVLMAIVLPVPEAIAHGDVLRARLISAVLTAALASGAAVIKGGRRVVWMCAAALAALAGGLMVVRHVTASSACVATYDDRSVLIGREFTPTARDYASQHPGASAHDLLLDAGGVADRIWTASSISSCGFWTGWAGLLSMPLFVGAVCAVVSSRGVRLGAASSLSPRSAATSAVRPPVYDAFLSYRHAEPDKTRADEILEALESRGFRVAIDVRDFVPNQHFLAEMERCITDSRFVLCVISPRYLDSDHCVEEAVISKTLDMSERTRRIVPLVFDRVELPVWLHGLVGIDFTDAARVDPVERLVGLLRAGSVTPTSPRS